MGQTETRERSDCCQAPVEDNQLNDVPCTIGSSFLNPDHGSYSQEYAFALKSDKIGQAVTLVSIYCVSSE
jgi:hypothetical protein